MKETLIFFSLCGYGRMRGRKTAKVSPEMIPRDREMENKAKKSEAE